MNTIDTHPLRRLRLGVIASALAAALVLAGCGKGEDAHAEEGDQHAGHAGEKKAEGGEEAHDDAEEALTLSAAEADRAGIKVEEAKAQAGGATLVVTATIQPDQDRIVHVAPRIEGRITAAPARLGERVRAGQTLATLDSVEVGEAHAAWAQAQSELRVAEADLERAKPLAADEIIPRKDLLRAQADRDKAAAALRAAAERLRLLGGSTANSGTGVSGFAVAAPFAGTVIEKKATLGNLASPSEALFTLADLSRVWIQADLPEAALARVRVGAKARVSVPAYPGEVFEGRVGYVGAVLDKDKRTVAARIEVANADGRLKPEMFATAAIEVAGAKTAEAISLPDAAIVLLQGQPTVFVFDAGVYEPRPVDPGERFGGRTLLEGGIKPGEQVVVAGAYALKARKLKSQLGHGH